MQDENGIYEPEIDPLADTSPSLALRPVQPLAGWRRAAGWLSLLAALGFTIATVLVLIAPGETTQTPVPPTEPVLLPSATPAITVEPTEVPEVAETTDPADTLPLLSAEAAAALLEAPLVTVPDPNPIRISSNSLDPFTTIPDRPRNEVIQYEAVQGDTINGIAERFGLQAESIAWANTRRLVQVLRPGDRVNILPVDGVYHTVVGQLTLADIAVKYKLDDPYPIIDSEYNDLFDATPETIPPSGLKVVVPGGEAEAITWNPTVEREDDGDGGSSGGSFITFASGHPGSCGRVANPGGGAFWTNPLPGGTWVRGYTSWHTGVDVAAAPGTPVFAAGGGRVIFRGWNNWGYGNTVVIAHGPFTTLYGHLQSVSVSCGQDVIPGSVVGAVGNTGNSSGPHLHFEVRWLDNPTDPLTIGVGW